MAKKSAEAGPQMQPQNPPAPVRHKRPEWVLFQTKGRCYAEGVFLEDSGMTLKLSPRGAFLQRNNKNLEIHPDNTGEIPVLPDGAPADTKSPAYREFVNAFAAELETGDPIVGAAPKGLTLIKQ